MAPHSGAVTARDNRPECHIAKAVAKDQHKFLFKNQADR